MLFNSYAFIFGFLPLVWVAFFLLGRHSRLAAAGWLALASLFFYGWWSVRALPLLIGSICVNYLFGVLLTRASGAEARSKAPILALAVAANLVLLGFFKYADFFIANANVALAAAGLRQMDLLHVLLPIGISFFTFTQIAFLVDCWQGKLRERNFVHYALFVTYFPHLVAGPVLHHAQMMPQFARGETYSVDWNKVATGMAIFIVGLAKKLLIADPLGTYADVIFRNADLGFEPALFIAWFGVICYAFQIYFDFSGYSDMAIGLSLLFGIHLPLNFNSPYKATSIIDFWRRWHMSLSTFLRDYLYIPLGGNKNGKTRRYVNLLATMVLGGLWHGANWTFVLWGAAHGVLLIVNHAWRKLTGGEKTYGPVGTAACWLITFLAVCFTWVPFRADSVETAFRMFRGMLGFNGLSLPRGLEEPLARYDVLASLEFAGLFQGLISVSPVIVLMFAVYCFVLSLGNMNAYSAPGHRVRPRFLLAKGFVMGGLFGVCLLNLLSNKSPQFLYFQF